ncbi:DUF2333 family protein [Parashewanella spongiae]|uniref:DUF2333 family protein n=1 Tax=Parashewanella spongiae TaxID=342950 RepID=A0A3A6U7N1_9GAMM|nr:DUF2333 family protein [Parashewanella spongiae]MCL1078320.1 DUF2333 family protein [Parashewanella spongiae]RJY17471.1 DUF2333 family protein [Parashewanella spongiae]
MAINWNLQLGKKIAIGLVVMFVLLFSLGVWWGIEPDPIQPETKLSTTGQTVVGYATSSALINTVTVLLEKPGGWTSNDTMPPSVFMDNMHAFEFGALEQARDLVRVMRKEFSRSQSQSVENQDLSQAQAKLNIDHTSWLIPRPETEYRDAVNLVNLYRQSITDPNNPDVQFYARADNLNEWLRDVKNRLGSLSQRLSASVATTRVNTDLAGDPDARQSTFNFSEHKVKTSWWKIDDVFYETKGSAWALLNFMRAVEVDFADVLEKKNARASFQQIIRELEATQQPVWSPMIFNGSGFGLLANHSLVMANYISRANAAIIDLTHLLSKG